MRAAARLAAALLAFGLAGAAQATGSPYLEELTWTELRDAVRAGKTTVLVPIGGTEQNGPHMVLGKHNVRARVLAGRIAERLGNALVAPVIAYVPEGSLQPPTQHMRFPGTITIPADAFETTLASAARSFALHGFRDVVFLGDHGGYRASVERTVASLNRAWARGPARAYAPAEYYGAAQDDFARALEAQGFGKREIGTHAGLADTALALDADPRLVRAERLGAPTQANDGVAGDPRRATRELGAEGSRLVVERTARAIVESIARR